MEFLGQKGCALRAACKYCSVFPPNLPVQCRWESCVFSLYTPPKCDLASKICHHCWLCNWLYPVQDRGGEDTNLSQYLGYWCSLGHKSLTEPGHQSPVKSPWPRWGTIPDEGLLRHQGVVAAKGLIHFFQGVERLSYQEKVDSLCVLIRAEKVTQVGVSEKQDSV